MMYHTKTGVKGIKINWYVLKEYFILTYINLKKKTTTNTIDYYVGTIHIEACSVKVIINEIVLFVVLLKIISHILILCLDF